MRIHIPGNTPSLKNSKVATVKGVFHSKTVRKYLQKLGVKKYSVSKKTVENYKTRPNLFEAAVKSMRADLKKRKPPHIIGFHFVRDSKHKFDITNAMAIVCDLLVAHDVIEDDNADHLIPMPIKINNVWYQIDKEFPCCIVEY
ncbi:MAG: hypothetical protein Q7J67_00250 [bacterium]|nr:hypothetical protein [bacterium]